jgi:hypothetical protein
MLKRTAETETVHLPAEIIAAADRQVAAIVRRCCYDDNIVESVARSCYLQGVRDGVQLAASRPDVVQAITDARP